MIGGHELVGEVVAVADRIVEDIASGQRVAVDPTSPRSCFFSRRQVNHCPA